MEFPGGLIPVASLLKKPVTVVNVATISLLACSHVAKLVALFAN